MTRGGRLLGALLTTASIALACGGGGSSASTEPPAAGSGTVMGAAGGTITAGDVVVVVPAGALASDVTIAVTDDGLAPAGYVVRGKVYRFAPSGLRFAIPVSVTMPGSAPTMMFWTDEGSEDRFTAQASTYGAGVTSTVTQFSSGFVGTREIVRDASSDARADAGDAGEEGAAEGGLDGGGLVCASACAPGKKRCSNVCVTLTDPTYGCSTSSCDACSPASVARTAAAKCTGDHCAVGRCFAGFADCNATWEDGCESDTASPDTCGVCGKKCAAGEVCDGGTCAAACALPKTSCAGRCRDLSSDPAACGACDAAACPSVQGTATCTNGTCGVVCDSGFATCGSASLSNLQNGAASSSCGACNTPCTAAAGESASCVAGTCVKACAPGYTLCAGACADLQVDAGSCGACGVACAAGELCLGGACKPETAVRVVTGLGAPGDVAVDQQNLYYADTATNEVWQVDKKTFVPTLLASGQASPFRIVVDDAYVYWSSNLGGAILRAPIGGGAPASVLYPANKPAGIAVDATYIYWADSGTSKIFRAPKTPGGAAVAYQFVGGLGGFIAADELQVDAGRLFGSSTGCMAGNLLGVFSLDKTIISGGTLTPLGGCAPGMHYGIALAGGHGYSFFGYSGQPQPSTLLQHGTEAALSIPAMPLGRGALRADACAQYWTDGKTGVWKHSSVTPFVGETAAHRLTAAGTTTGRLAIDDAYVYWTDVGFIGRVPK